MNPSSITPPSKAQPWRRSFLTTVLQAALTAGEANFIRRSTLAWLAAYPGDLPVKLVRAKALIAEGQYQQARLILQAICRTDPEFVEAQDLL
jgi:predicted Zn-dependent protease